MRARFTISGPACGARPAGIVRHSAGSNVERPCRAPQAGPLNGRGGYRFVALLRIASIS
jgi:hypothetical protein